MYPPVPLPPSSSSRLPNWLDSSPLLTSSPPDHIVWSRRQPLSGAAARLLRHAGTRRMMLREPSVRIRENAAEQLEERQSDWAYSKPIIVLDILWNLAFLVISVAVLWLSVDETPDVPLRLWIIGYNFQCLFHVGCVVAGYKRRQRGRDFSVEDNQNPPSHSNDDDDSDGYGLEEGNNEYETSFAKHLESVNTMFSFVWWIIGFYWVTANGNALVHASPQLYWLSITFLAFDVIFVVICVAVACLIGIAVCCCLPCVIAILYALADRVGAADEEIDRLPKFRFRRVRDTTKNGSETQESCGGIMTEFGTDTPIECYIPKEVAECCICLSAYDEGAELRELPCRHHFHSACIDRWLHLNATCPLCKFNILKAGSDHQDCSEERV